MTEKQMKAKKPFNVPKGAEKLAKKIGGQTYKDLRMAVHEDMMNMDNPQRQYAVRYCLLHGTYY